jgi:long-chain acyl-CoA synthetase
LDLGFNIAGYWHGMAWMQRQASPPSLPAGTAKICFTSGSTGHPKGVCLSAAGLIDTAIEVASRLADLPIDCHLASLPLALLLENTAGIYAPLLRGAEIHLPSLQSIGWQGMAGFDPGALHKAASAIQPSSMILVPELLKAWTLYLETARRKAPPSLSYVAVGGARVDANLIGKARALGLPAYQGYGLTECGSVVSMNRPGDDGDDVGRPLGHVTVEFDAGEIVISTRSFLGYLDKHASIGAAGRNARFATGDLGHIGTRGHLHLSGRRKNLLINSYGRNIAPEWVEASLLAQPAISQAVVTGDNRPWLCSVLVPAPHSGAEALAAAVARANAALPDYARICDWLIAEPFTLQNGQATGNGRPVRAAILEKYAAPLAALYQHESHANAVL